MNLIKELTNLTTERLTEARRGKAGCIPYVLGSDGSALMAFMISSDAAYGGPDPMIAKGGIDEGETAERAGVREAEEELGLKTSNIVQDTLKLGWEGELSGYDATYKFSVFMCQVDDVQDFNEPHYETKEVVWLTAKEFKSQGRKSQHHIVQAIANKIESLAEGEVVQGNFPQHGKVYLSFRRDAGDEWKYWNGVNWFAPKTRALAVDVKQIEKLEHEWGFKARVEKA